MQYRKETGEDFHNPQREKVYRGPKPTIPDFTKGDPREFARLKISLDNILPEDAMERFKYQILLDHLKFEDALLIADSYTNSRRPYSDTMASLAEQYGQPHQLAPHHIADLMEGSSIRSHDTTGFKKFALKVRALVGMLDQLGESEVHAPLGVRIPTLLNFAEWLEYELTIQESGFKFVGERKERPGQRKDRHKDFKSSKTLSIFHSLDPSSANQQTEGFSLSATRLQDKVKAYCPYCSNTQHYLNQCQNFSQLTKEQKSHWVKTNKKCWRCGRTHQAAQCRLKITCKICKGRHLEALHELNDRPVRENPPLSSPTNEVLYLDRQAGCSQVLLKVTKVILRNGEHVLETFAILDDGSERTILLQAAAQKLNLHGKKEDLVLRTVRQDMKVIRGNSVSFSISPACQPQRVFKINRAFTADQLGLAEHTYPIKALQSKYSHLRGLPIPALDKAHPLLLIGSDYSHLITPIAPVLLGPSGGPAAVRTRLGWTVQGPAKLVHYQLQSQQCLNISVVSPSNELFKNVQQLWQLDVLPYKNEKLVTRSKQDQEAINLLEAKTKRIDINGIQRYATPLLRGKAHA
ncbi:DNA polymerase II large subunit [Labeo rohita]|uniref:DNA polymerase II large subunit n=1 Tax=Labeo rohita TaxID=84645 RepID=A0ABQ8LA93_LABRO|nr:DNA polymerase II large subunit [Labeo rohita]